MKLSHAAAIVLGGWYLVVPPAGHTFRVGLRLPLSQWATVGTFDNAGSCEAGKRKGLPTMEERIKANARKAGVSATDADVQQLAQLALRCVASDDPRLKAR